MLPILLSDYLELGVSEWKEKKTFYIRKKYLNEEGQLAFGKQGVNIKPSEWKVFKKNWETIKKEIDDFFGLEAVDIVERDPLEDEINQFIGEDNAK